MENKTSKRIKLLIGAVLVSFLAITAFDFVAEGGEAFARGFRAGQADAEGMIGSGPRHMFSSVTPLDPDTEALQLSGGVTLVPLKIDSELVVPEGMGRRSGWAYALILLMSFAIVGATLFFLVSLGMFAVGFPRRPILSHDNIVQMRRIAWSFGAIGLITCLMMLQEWLWLRANVVLEGYEVQLSLTPSMLIVALILIAMTEIMNLAGKLQREQDLTI